MTATETVGSSSVNSRYCQSTTLRRDVTAHAQSGCSSCT